MRKEKQAEPAPEEKKTTAGKTTAKKAPSPQAKRKVSANIDPNTAPGAPRADGSKSPVNGQPVPVGRKFEPGEKQREISRKAGRKSGQIRRARKTLRQELLDLLSARTLDKDGTERSQQESLSIALIRQAREGNVKAFEVIRDTIGEKQREVVEMNVTAPKFDALDAAFREMERKAGDGR